MLLCYGVWFQLFIGTTVHYKLPEHDSTNLRGDKCKNGQSYCEYINDCLPPNVVCEKCNLNEIECESVNNSTSCVPPKRFNRRGSGWQWCGDGRCVLVRTSCGTSPCKHNEFLCGGECKSQEYQDQFRTCEGKCVKRDEHCLKEPVIIVGSLGWAALIMLAIVLVMLAFAIAIAIVLVMLAIFGVYYIYKWCTDSAGEMDRDMSPADTLDASMNDVHSCTITMPSTATGGAVPLNTVLQPALKKRRSVTRLQEKDIVNNKTSKYLLTTQNQDVEGGLETRLYKTTATRNYDFVLREDIEHAGSFSCPSNCGGKKGTLGFADSTYSQGDVLPTAGGGRQVVFNDVEVLTQTSPTAEESPKKRSYEVFEGIGARIAHLQERGVEGESTTPGYAERITKRSKRL